MLKIGLIPLDSRPCNTVWIDEFSKIANFELNMYPREKCGDLFRGADIDEMIEWLDTNSKNLDYLLISTDGLTFGGLVQSRKADINLEETIKKLSVIERIKKENPNLKIGVFDTIMRNGITCYDEESLKYHEKLIHYAQYKGRSYFLKDEEDIKKLEEIQKEIPEHILSHYLYARKVKRTINEFFIGLYAKGVIDKYSMLQEDSAPYGIQAIDQEMLFNKMDEYGIKDQILLYNGTDEGACVTLAAFLNDYYKLNLKVYVQTPNDFVLSKCHKFEDRPFRENLNKMFKEIGITESSYEDSDFVLSIYGEERNDYLDCAHYIIMDPLKDDDYKKYIKDLNRYIKEKPVFLADLFFGNGGCYELLEDIDYKGLYGYSAWNTASNTMGSLLGHVLSYFACKNKELSDKFTRERVMDDCVYQYIARRKATQELLEKKYNDLNLEEGNEVALELVNKYMHEYDFLYPEFKYKVILPWNRMFECEIVEE